MGASQSVDLPILSMLADATSQEGRTTTLKDVKDKLFMLHAYQHVGDDNVDGSGSILFVPHNDEEAFYEQTAAWGRIDPIDTIQFLSYQPVKSYEILSHTTKKGTNVYLVEFVNDYSFFVDEELFDEESQQPSVEFDFGGVPAPASRKEWMSRVGKGLF